MLFNKKPDEDFKHDFSSKRQPAMSYPTEMAPVPARKANGAPTRALIDAWLTITGNLQSEGEVQVDGKINGDIRCTHLTVGKDAAIIGNITAEEVVVRGKVTGTIRANRVILQDSSRVDSEIFHKKIAIEEGAVFQGQSRLSDDPINADLINLKSVATEMRSTMKPNGKHSEHVAA